jgi:DNA-binding transcriptional LysR family regulator
MPTLRALECLVAVVEAGSITDAASALHTSQPAVSHQLATLEREVGTALFERLPRGVRLTTAGRAVERDARASVAAAERVVRTGRAVAAGRGGQLRLGCAQTLTTTLVAPVLRAWRRRHPAVAVTLSEATSADDLARALDAGELDLAVAPRPSRWDGALTVVGTEEVVLAMATDHPLAASTAGPVPYARLDGQAAVHYRADIGLAGWLDARLAEHGARLEVTLRTGQVGAAAQLASAGLGIALAPVSSLGASFPGALRRLEPPLRRKIVVLVANPADRLAGRFAEGLAAHGIRVPRAIAAELEPPPAGAPGV